MSARQPATAWVWRFLVEIPTDAVPERLRVTLLALATYANPDGSEAYPSAASIGAGLGVSESAASRRLRRLDEMGITVRTATISLGEHARRIVRRIDRDRLEDLTSRAVSQVTGRSGGVERAEKASQGVRKGVSGLPNGHLSDRDHPIDHPTPSHRTSADEIGAPQSDDDQEDDSVNQLSIMPDATGTAPVVRIADRTGDPFDSVWASFVELFGEPTTPTKALRAKICRELVDRGADGAEVTRRAAALVELWGDARYVTDTTLWKHWSRFDGMISHVDDRAIEAAKARDRRAAIDTEKARLAAEGPWGIETGE